jgi:type I restriction enzyme M protein
MLDAETKSRINSARDILVGKVPDPKSQVEQITIALIYKFMDDMDLEAEELGGKRTFFSGEYAKYSWRKIFDPRQSGYDLLNLYSEAIAKMDTNPGVPKLFRDIFKNAYLPYRDPETLKSFLKIINEFEYTHSEKLGDAFEFLLSILGSQGDAGQFRTPRHIIDFMVEIIDPKKQEIILDPACGTAGFLISSYKHIIKQNSSNYIPEEATKIVNDGTQSVNEVIITSNGYGGDKLTADDRRILADNMHGYDISPDMVRLSLANMYLHGIKEPQIFEYDSLTSEDHWNEYSDVILANPPFMSPKGGIRPHKRFSVQSNRSEVLFVDYIAEHLTPDGRAAVIVPEGIIFQSGKAYKQLRKMLVEKFLVGVISLPAGVFNPYSGVKTSILWLDKSLAKKTDKILFVKIENDGFDLGAQRRAVKGNDLPVALHWISEFKNRISKGKQDKIESETNIYLIRRDEISCNGDYNLSGERYKKKDAVSRFELVTLGDVCDFEYGYTESAKDSGNTRFVRITDIDKNGTISEKGKKYIDLNEENKKYLLTRGDIIIARTGATYGKTAIYEGNEPSIFASFLIRIKVDPKLLMPKYLWLLTWSDKYWEQAQRLVTGGGQPQFNANAIKQIQIPLHPLHIQMEIVSEIDSYQKIIDGARQVVENYKPRIEIDPEWEMVELGEVCIINPKKNELKDLQLDLEVSFVPMADLNENLIYFEPKQIKHLNEVIKSYTYFRNNDVLLARVTPCFENGKAGVALNLRNEIGFGSSEYTVLRCSNKVIPLWIYFWVTDETFRNSGKLRMTGTGGLQRVPNDFVSSYKVPVPNIETQENIIEQIKIEYGVVESNKKLIKIFEQKIKDRIAKVWGE